MSSKQFQRVVLFVAAYWLFEKFVFKTKEYRWNPETSRYEEV